MLAQRFVTTLSLLLCGYAMAQDVAPSPAPSFGSKEKPTINADKSSSNERVVTVEPQRLDLGEIATGEKGKGTVTLTNGGKAAVVLTKCKTSCGCTTANCPEGQTIEPGGTVEVSISLDGGQVARTLTKTVTFLIENHPPVQMQVSAKSIAFVNCEPQRLDPDLHPDGLVTISCTDGTPFKIESMYPPVVTEFAAEAKTSHEVRIDWEAYREAGYRQRRIVFRTDHPKGASVSTTLAMSAVKPITKGDAAAKPAPSLPASERLDQLLKDSVVLADAALRQARTDTILKMIADAEIKPNALDSSYQTPLMKACRWGNEQVVFALLDAGDQLDKTDRMGRNPLMFAVRREPGVKVAKIEIVRALLDAGADPKQKDQIGNTPLCWAAGFGDLPTVKELIQAGAGVEVVGGMIGFTPLIWGAGFNEDPKVVEYLLSLDADIEAKDVLQGATPLMHAARTNMHENVALLIKSGADLKATDNEGNNALLMAAKNAGADAKMIGILVDAGCELSAKDKNGMDALASARKRSDLRAEDVVAALEQAYEAAGLSPTAP